MFVGIEVGAVRTPYVPTQADLSSAIPPLGICAPPNVVVEFASFKFFFDLPNDCVLPSILYKTLSQAVVARFMDTEIIRPRKRFSSCL
jgi:hypothetical protein